ncbi:MAG TPA: ABC transporter permease, partial [Gemmatimonadaceae bacterium]|nr:ABC transporter permease [Gemmatimonadaceae bacterium]
MDKLWVITAREYLERVRTRWFLFSTVFGPVFFAALMILPAIITRRTKASEDVARIVVLDATGREVGRRIADGLSVGMIGDTARTRVRELVRTELAPAESAATKEIVRGALTGYLVLDSAALEGKRVRYAGRNASAEADMDMLRRVVRESLMETRLEMAGVARDQSSALARTRVEFELERITDRGRGGSAKVSVIFALIIVVMLYMALMLYGQAVLRGVMEEKQTRVAEVVISSVPSWQLLGGKVIGVGAVGLTQLAVWIGSGLLLLRYRQPLLDKLGVDAVPFTPPDVTVGMGLVLLLFFVAGYVFYSSLFAAVGAMVSSEQEAQQALMPIILLLVSSFVFFQPILSKPTSGLAHTLSWLPFS